MAQFTNKIAVVTGSTQGLGLAIAELFAERGAAGLVLCGRNKEKGEARARDLTTRFGTKAIFVAADLARVEDCRAVIAQADKTFGRIDTLVNSAGNTNRGTMCIASSS